MVRTLEQHLNPGIGPKRILSLSGGGVRGLITLGILEALERQLQETNDRPEARLSDHFDLIAGTSTGSIIATGLALGWEVERLRQLYLELCPLLFGKKSAWGYFAAKFKSEALNGILNRQMADVEGLPLRLGDQERLRTGLMICAKRMDTDSAWVLTNHPESLYYNSKPGQTWAPNKSFRLASLVRASAAAPTYFEPVEIEVFEGNDVFEKEVGLFVDGAISGHNCPALIAFQVATLPQYAFDWPTGPDRISVLSIGTGQFRNRQKLRKLASKPPVLQGLEALSGLINESQRSTIMTMQAMSEPDYPWPINSEAKGLEGGVMTGAPVLKFRHVDAMLDRPSLTQHLGLETLSGKKVDKITKAMLDMTNGHRNNLSYCQRLGAAIGTGLSEADLFL